MSKNTNKAVILVSAMFASSVLLSGCGLFSTETEKKIDPPKSVSMDNSKKESKETVAKTEDAQNTIKTELYLINKNGYVVPQTIALPKKTSTATQAMEYLVDNGPVEDMLPNGFRAVIPAETTQDGS